MTFLVWAGGASHSYPYYCTTYPEAWVTTYLEPGYFDVDLVLDIIRWGLLPVDWSFWSTVRSARTHGIGSYGLTIPVRGPNGERSLFP
ncbi:autoinducer binding domain-containing protein [Ensifer sp. ENS04]|nr:autoinducer binding domain-containing protein [Ensifer sp. ENS04]